MPVHDSRSSADAGMVAAAQDAAAQEGQAVTPRSGRRGWRESPQQADGLAGRMPRSWRLPMGTYAACQLIFLFWCGAFYPGLMNRDSLVYIQHVTTGPWVNNHSVLYDSMVWLSLHATGDLGALTLVQTIAMSAALAYTVSAFRRIGVPGRWTAIAAVIVSALPSTGSFVIFIWKDVPFSICAFLVVPTLAHLVSLRRAPGWPRQRPVNPLIASLALELLGMCLFRQDGFLVVALAAAALAAVIAGIRVRLITVAATAIGLTFLLNLVIFPALGILRPDSSLVLGPAYADLAVAYAQSPSSFTPADKHLMARAAPLAEWKKSADCYNSDKTNYLPHFTGRTDAEKGQLFALWLRVLRQSPGLILDARICRGSIAWVIFPLSHGAVAFPYDSKIPVNLFHAAEDPGVRDNPYRADMATRPLWGYRVAHFLRIRSESHPIAWLLFRGATWCYITYLAVGILALRRKDLALLALTAIVAGQQLVAFADSPTQVFRYMATPLLIGPMLLPLFLGRTRASPSE
jgi:hypothetical protein